MRNHAGFNTMPASSSPFYITKSPRIVHLLAGDAIQYVLASSLIPSCSSHILYSIWVCLAHNKLQVQSTFHRLISVQAAWRIVCCVYCLTTYRSSIMLKIVSL